MLSLEEIRALRVDELDDVAALLRSKIIETLSEVGGHLSSNLGSIELILAMHYVYPSPYHPFIFDVSHQAYAHKLLTSRFDRFNTLRSFNGISGFTHPSESIHDYFIAGHSSTSLSLATGLARANLLNGGINFLDANVGRGGGGMT